MNNYATASIADKNGEDLDITGTIITAEYPDGPQVWGFDSASQLNLGMTWPAGILTVGGIAGKQPITVQYMDITTAFEVEVGPKAASIAGVKQPDNTFYSLGDVLIPPKWKSRTSYENGKSDVLDNLDYIVYSEGFSDTAGTKTLDRHLQPGGKAWRKVEKLLSPLPSRLHLHHLRKIVVRVAEQYRRVCCGWHGGRLSARKLYCYHP